MKGMNASFCVNNRVDGHSVGVDVHSVNIHKIELDEPSKYEPGDYVAIHITDGDAGIEGQPDTDKRTYSTILLAKNEARAIASAIMGVAAQI